MEVFFSILILFSLIFLGLPIGLSLGMSATLGLLLIEGFSFTASSLSSLPATILSQNGMIVIPLFVMMGYFILHAGIAKDIFSLCSRIIGNRLPGGLGVAAVLGCAIFAGISGSSAATVASIGRISYEEMLRHGYSKSLSSGLVSMAGTLGIMIPPSSFLVIYALLAEVSIQKMLFAGILPGVISAVAYSFLIIYKARSEDFCKDALSTSNFELKVSEHQGEEFNNNCVLNRSSSFAMLSVLFIFLLVMGGMYLGYFTATEASAVGAVASGLLLGVVAVSRKISAFSAYKAAIVETTTTSSMIALLLVGGGVFAYFLVAAGVPQSLSSAAIESSFPPELIFLGLLFILIPLGMVVDGTSIMLIVTPLVVPLLHQFGYDPIWFGILLVKMIEIGLVSPPLGINVFVLTGSVKNLAAGVAFRGAIPFILAELVTVGLLFKFPEVVMWLPSYLD